MPQESTLAELDAPTDGPMEVVEVPGLATEPQTEAPMEFQPVEPAAGRGVRSRTLVLLSVLLVLVALFTPWWRSGLEDTIGIQSVPGVVVLALGIAALGLELARPARRGASDLHLLAVLGASLLVASAGMVATKLTLANGTLRWGCGIVVGAHILAFAAALAGRKGPLAPGPLVPQP